MMFYFQLTIIGKTKQTGEFDPKKLAKIVFETIGIGLNSKLTKEQFIDG